MKSEKIFKWLTVAALIVFMILFFMQDSDAQVQDSSKLSFAFTNKLASRQTVKIFLDTCHIFYHANKDYNSKVIWDAATSPETVAFIIPPKHIIVGNSSYTSIFLNGTWYLMMDPTNLKP